MTLTETILSTEVLVSALTIILIAALLALRNVGPRRALRFEALRTLAWRGLDPLARKRGRPLVRDKSTANDEFVCSVEVPELELAQALWENGYRWNPLSTKKYREIETRQWSILSAAFRDSVTDDKQHHVYVFRAGGGILDIYAHEEASVTDPTDHDGGDELVPGDPDGRVRDALDEAGIDYIKIIE